MVKDAIVFIYRDDYCIETLYNQIYDEVVETILSSSDKSEIDASINAGFLKIVNAETSGKINNINTEQRKIVTSIDRKTRILLDLYKTDSMLIDDIINASLPFKESIYFVGMASFFLTKIYDNKTGESILPNVQQNTSYVSLNENTMIELEAGNTDLVKKYCVNYVDSKDYFDADFYKETKNALRINMSNAKIKKNIRHITHDMKLGKHFNFYVFGEIIPSARKDRKTDNDTRYFIINPFAIWQ